MVNHCETCKHYEVEPYNEPCVSCRFRDYDVPTKWKSPFKTKTNADRIRAMSDEELAVGIKKIFIGKSPWCDHHCTLDDCNSCNACLKEWLKQPVKENEE